MPAATPTISFASGSSAALEGGSVTVQVELRLPAGQALAQAVTVTVQTSGSAHLGQDYDLPSTVTFPVGATNGRREGLSLATRSDGLVEGPEVAVLTLAGSTRVQIGAVPVHTVALQDASGTPTIAFATGTSAAGEAAGSHGVDVVLLSTRRPTPA